MGRIEEILDDPQKIKETDPKGMTSLVDRLPDMLEEGWLAAEPVNIPRPEKISNVIIAGMGGSAISGDIVNSILKDKVNIPVIVNRGYKCPRFAGKETLFIAVSYSGNTEETLSSYKEAIAAKANIVAISSGGDLKELSEKNGNTHISIPGGQPPRSALGYLLAPILNVLSKTGMARDIKQDIDDTKKLLKQLGKKRTLSVATRENEAKQLAVKLAGKAPVIMVSDGVAYAAGLRWKTQLNENSKVTAQLSVFPELNHNDMVNYSFLKPGSHNYQFILLRDDADLERMKKRIEITKSLISGFVGGITEIHPDGKSPLERVMSLIQLGDYVSVYLGIAAGIDPTPVDIIEKLKKELAR